MMRAKLSTSSIVQLEALLLAQLMIKPQTARELERATGSAHSVIARRLLALRETGAIHIRIDPPDETSRAPRVWAIGAGTETSGDPADHPQQILTKAAPVGAQRDELVAAIFGAGTKEPVCTYCDQPQGSAHTPGCAVARYV
jgi:hypothetical protein